MLHSSLFAQSEDADFRRDSIFSEEQLQKARELGENGGSPEALELYYKVLELQHKVFGEKHLKVGKTYNNIGNQYDDLGDYDKAVEAHQKGLKIKLEAVGDKENTVAISYLNLGVSLRHKGYLNQALECYEKALAIRLPLYGNEHIRTANVYENLAICYEERGDYDKAITYYEKVLAIRIAKWGEEDIDVSGTYLNIGGCMRSSKQFSKALFYLQKSLNIRKKHFGTELHPKVAHVYNNLGLCYKSDDQLEKALEMFNKSLEIKNKTLAPQHPTVWESNDNLGDTYFKKKNYDVALEYYKSLVKTSVSDADLAATYTQIGQCYEKKGNFREALIFQKKALQTLLNVEEGFIREERKADIHQSTLLSDPLLYHEILQLEASSYLNFYKKSKARIFLSAALKSYKEGIDFVESLRYSYTEPTSKVVLLEKVYNIYEEAIETCFELYKVTDSLDYVHQAFVFSEKAKSVLLLEAVQTTKAEAFAGIPDSLLEKEQLLQVDINRLEKQKFLLLQSGKKDVNQQITQLNTRIFDLKKSYEDLIARFEQEYPDYFDLKYNETIVAATEVQQLLTPEQNMLAYYVGDSSVFVFQINAQQIELSKINKDFPIQKWVTDVIKGVHAPDAPKSAMAAYQNAAYQLYEKLWKGFMTPSFHEVIVIPHADLGALPFEVLLSEKVAEGTLYRQMPYLIKEYPIAYNYSATLFAQQKQQISYNEDNQLLALAPVFADEPSPLAQRGLGSLKYNQEEVDNIDRILKINSVLLKAEKGTKNNWLQHAGQCNLLHLATHGKVNDLEADYSYLAFYRENETTDEDKLFVKDLYSLKLQADMVVLSACETGIGELRQGEGIISLARGFFYAGAKSIVTTLWKVSDKSSAEIMEYFYKNIRKGMTKDKALRQAKLKYMKKNPDRLVHPFFWAAYIPIGNMEVVEMERGIWKWYALGGVLVILGFLLGRIFFRKSEAI